MIINTETKITFGIAELYCGKSGQKGFYNNQEIGLAKAMHRLGFQVVVFSPDKETDKAEEVQLEEGITLVSCPAKSIGVHGHYDWNILLKYGIDVCEVPADNDIFAPDLVKFCDQHEILAYNYLGTIHSDTKNAVKRAFMDLLLQRNIRMMKKHQCFAKTEAVRKQLEELGVKDAIVAPVGLDLTIIPEIHDDQKQLREQLHLPLDQKLLLFVGRMDAYKHPLDALELLNQLPPEFSLIMIGTGQLDEKADALIHANGLDSRVIRIRKIENSRIHEYYRAADYFLNFNPEEIFGMSILEAMYQDCTVMARRAPGPSFIIEDGKNGFLSSSIDEMARQIKEGKRIPEGNARTRILQSFTWERTASIMYDWIIANLRDKTNINS